jgi:subtilisin family serine protease
MAAPHVAGVAALLLAQDPRRSREDVRGRLLATTHGAARLVDARAALGVPPPGTSSQAQSPPQPVEPRPTLPAGTPGAPPADLPPTAPVPPAPGGPVPLPGAPGEAAPPGGPAPAPELAGPALPPRAAPTSAGDPEQAPASLIAAATALLVAAGGATFVGSRR